jgi:IclR family KDG regulon transcriptional repressor
MGRKSEIDILASFEDERPQSAAQIIKKTGLPRSTVFRALRLLVDAGFIRQEAVSTQYMLGPRLLQLGLIARQQLSPEEVVAPPLLSLATQSNETVTFSLVDLPWRVCVFVLDAPSDLRSVAQAGSRYALHRGGASSAILAHLPEKVAIEVLRYHGVSQREIAKTLTHMAEIRTAGSVVSINQRVAGASSVAAPVFVGGHILGSVAVAGPSDRMAPNLEKLRPTVVAVAQTVSEQLSVAPADRASGRNAG